MVHKVKLLALVVGFVCIIPPAWASGPAYKTSQEAYFKGDFAVALEMITADLDRGAPRLDVKSLLSMAGSIVEQTSTISLQRLTDLHSKALQYLEKEPDAFLNKVLSKQKDALVKFAPLDRELTVDTGYAKLDKIDRILFDITAYNWERDGGFYALAIIFERKVIIESDPAKKLEWKFLSGKADQLHNESGAERLKEYLEGTNFRGRYADEAKELIRIFQPARE